MSSSMLDWFLSTLTPTPTESHMPSTAEIIQKCLNVNPFDLKFREANMQINGQTSEQNGDTNGTQLNLTNPAGLTMLKLPSSLAQSPSIFSNLNALNAVELENGLRRKLRENAAFVKQEGNKTPCTADVLNAVLDMNMNNLSNGPITIPSTSSLVAGLAGIPTTSSLGTTILVHDASSVDAAVSSVKSSDSSNSAVCASTSQMPTEITFTELVTEKAEGSKGNELLSNNNITNMISHSSTLNALTASVNHSMPNLHSDFSQNNVNGPSSNGLVNNRASPALSTLSPRSTGRPYEVNKHSVVTSVNSTASVADHWDTVNDVKPFIQKPLNPYNTFDGLQNCLELNTNIPSEGSVSSSQPNSHVSDAPTKPRKYGRYQNPSSNESHVTQGSGRGRGRRSLTSDMPPDERRVTILERNKAAAVRYRKRKKEEHDDMIGRVHGLEQDKVFLTTQNNVLRREVERLTDLLKIRDARCICRASNGLMPTDCGPSLENEVKNSMNSVIDHSFILQNNSSQPNM